MRNWHTFYEVLKYPIAVLFVAITMIGLGNIFINPAFPVVYLVNNEYIQVFAELFIRFGQFVVQNFPVLVLIRLTTRKSGSATTIISAISGYIMFLVATLFFASPNLPTTAYSSILGLSYTSPTLVAFKNTVRYPLQTGMISAALMAFITLWSFNKSRRKSEFGVFSFISKETFCAIRTVFFGLLAGIGVAYVWTYLVAGIQAVIRFISVDTTNPVNLTLYGIFDRVLADLNLGTMIRQPFWYATNGGSWINSAGMSVTGDVSIWTEQLSANALTGMAGRFITPYYVMNIFAVPAMILSMYFLNTDRMERAKTRMFFILAGLVSIFTGTLLPLELLLLLLCPLLYLFHIGYTGILFGVFQALHVYLGYNSTEGLTSTAMPGTLMEMINYIRYPSLTNSIIIVVIVGVVSAVIYYFVTRLYFKTMSLDVLKTGKKDTMINELINAIGGLDNIKMIHSSIRALTISPFDVNKIDMMKLRKLGAYRLYETRAGLTICFGASATMINDEIRKRMNDSVREINIG